MDQPSNQDLFHAALNMPPEERAAYLDDVCQANPTQKEEIQSLLDSHDEAHTFLGKEPAPLPTVSFHPPKCIQQYELIEQIGEGAMGVVFKAKDTTLGRIVAIKFLKPEIYPTHQSVDRLQREAKALAAVNSPHIATVHDLIESDGVCAIVLEYVEGESLRQRLDRRRMAMDGAIQIAMLISEGLRIAHEKGIIHRDLKPSNVILTKNNGLKILDFGLAKLEMELHSAHETHAGTLMGTTAYMSPEQTRGESVTSKSDLWSLACVLYEMLTSTHPFLASNTADTIANILKSAPAWEPLPPDLPSPIFYLLRQCLMAAPESRPSDASAVNALLSASLETSFSKTNSQKNQVSLSKTSSYSRIFWVCGLCSIFAVFGLFMGNIMSRPKPELDSGSHKTNNGKSIKIPVQFGTPFNYSNRGGGIRLSISPDASQVVYSNDLGLWHQSLETLEPARLLTRSRVQETFWNPTSSAVAYLQGQTLFAHSIESNMRTALVELPGPVVPNHGGGSWLPNNELLFNTGDGGIKSVTLHQPDTLHTLLEITDDDDNFHESSALPNNRGLLFVTHRRNQGIDTLSVWTKETQRKDIYKLPGQMLGFPVYSRLGFILFLSAEPNSNVQYAKIWAFPFDLETLEKTGPKFLVEEKSEWSLSIADDNTLVHQLPRKVKARRAIAWLNSPVSEAKYPERGFERDSIMAVSLSPNQSKVAFTSADSNSIQLWVHNFDSATSRLINTRADIAGFSRLMWADEDNVIYTTWGSEGVFAWIKNIETPASSRKISPGMAVTVSRNGDHVIMQGLPRWGHHTVIRLDTNEAESKVLPGSLTDAWGPKFSPSQKFLSFVAGEERKDSFIYLSDYPDGQSRFVVNKNLDGKNPFWHPTKDILYFIHPNDSLNEIYSVNVTSAPGIQLSEPKFEVVLPKSTLIGGAYSGDMIEYHAEKERFLLIEDQTVFTPGNESRGNAVIIPNWQPKDLFETPPSMNAASSLSPSTR